MEMREETKAALISHWKRYPKLQIQDLFKYLYQSSFGCEHLISSLEAVERDIREEAVNCTSAAIEFVEPLDGDYPACHHSESFRKEYAPDYRPIKKEYAMFLPLFLQIDRMLREGEVNLAIEGGSASGKTTLGKLLAQVYDCTVFHMDDFFLRPEQRTGERFAEPGGNVDRERFLEEVLVPLSKREQISYRRFDCSTFTLAEPVLLRPSKLNVIEGAYSMHPELRKYYNLSVFLDISPELQKQRIRKRNTPELAKRFFEEWIPMEQRYFDKFNVKENCDMVWKTE